MYVTLSPYKDNKNMEKMQENQWFFLKIIWVRFYLA